MMKPRVFIGSSGASLEVAHAVQAGLHHGADVRVWDQDVFQLGQFNLEALLRQLERSQVGIFVFAADDVVVMKNRTVQAVRDNVIFEFGLFVGRLGRERVFALVPAGTELHLPSDLAGVVYGEYDPDDELVSSVGPFCFKVKQALKRLSEGAPMAVPSEARSTEQVLQDVVDDIRSLVQKQLSTQYIGVFPSFLRAHVLPCLRDSRSEIRIATNSSSIAYFSDYDAWMEYRKLLRERKDGNVQVRCVWMAEHRLQRELENQFAKTEEEWDFLTQSTDQAEFQQHLSDLNERIITDDRIRTPRQFYHALTKAESQAREWLVRYLGADNVAEVDLPMPLNLWVSDERSAVFSIPAYGPNKTEYGFETREPNLVVALRAVWQLYRDNAVRQP
jgi:hypothetical protein